MNTKMKESIKILKKINFFTELEKKKIVSQNVISKNILVSLGMVNALLKKAILKGLVKAKSAPYKRYIYYLTKQGFSEKSNLVREYLDDSLEFYKNAKKAYCDILIKLTKKKIFIVGTGDLEDISKLAAIQMNVDICDRLKVNKNNKLVLTSEKILKHTNKNVYLIIETKNPQKIYDLLKKQVPRNCIFHPKFLHISDFKAEDF